MPSTYLTRTFSSGNRKKYTQSYWIKLMGYNNATGLSVRTSNNTAYNLYINSSYNIDWYVSTTGSGFSGRLKTNRVFRDPNAWYHIVAVVDTTQSTASDRLKLYINGVQETSFSLATYPSLNEDTPMNDSGNTYFLGSSRSTDGYLNGCYSHFHFCDGYAYQASDFGSVDNDTGEWKINTSPNVQYGTNGFFMFKDGNSVTDQSGNSNNFTVGAGTLTKTEDNPSNVFATLNPLSGSLSNNTLTQGNNTLQSTSGWRWRPSTICASSGKYYAEFKPTSGGNIYTVIGVTPQVSWDSIDGETIGAGSGSEAESVGFSQAGSAIKGNSTVYSGSTYTTNDIIGVALDLDNYKVYFSKNGTWQNSGVPTSGSTGTGAVSLSSTLSDWSISVSSAGSTISCNYGNGYFGTTQVSSAGTNASGNGIFEYDVPTGYTALSTKGLNL